MELSKIQGINRLLKLNTDNNFNITEAIKDIEEINKITLKLDDDIHVIGREIYSNISKSQLSEKEKIVLDVSKHLTEQIEKMRKNDFLSSDFVIDSEDPMTILRIISSSETNTVLVNLNALTGRIGPDRVDQALNEELIVKLDSIHDRVTEISSLRYQVKSDIREVLFCLDNSDVFKSKKDKIKRVIEEKVSNEEEKQGMIDQMDKANTLYDFLSNASQIFKFIKDSAIVAEIIKLLS